MLTRILIALTLSSLVGCRSLPDPGIQSALVEVSSERMRANIEELCELGPRPFGDPEATARAQEWIRGELEALGVQVQEERGVRKVQAVRRVLEDGAQRLVMSHEESEVVNLIAAFPGARRPWQVIEVGAHYDTVPGSPGADDNASGIVALLELARILHAKPCARSVRLVFYGAEEVGLAGSDLHAERVAARTDEHLLGAISLDMVGFALHEPNTQRMPVRIPLLFDPPTTADFILVAGNFPSGGIGSRVEAAARAYAPDLAYYSVNRVAGFVADGWRSDHASYWRHGLRAIQLGDSADMRSPHYHRASDTPETLDYEFLEDVTRAVAGAVLEWAR